jgi:hypothetical protein
MWDSPNELSPAPHLRDRAFPLHSSLSYEQLIIPFTNLRAFDNSTPRRTRLSRKVTLIVYPWTRLSLSSIHSVLHTHFITQKRSSHWIDELKEFTNFQWSRLGSGSVIPTCFSPSNLLLYQYSSRSSEAFYPELLLLFTLLCFQNRSIPIAHSNKVIYSISIHVRGDFVINSALFSQNPPISKCLQRNVIVRFSSKEKQKTPRFRKEPWR